MRASFSPQSEPSAGLGIGSPFRGGNPLSCALYATCSPGDSGLELPRAIVSRWTYTDLPSPPPSSNLTLAVATECSPIGIDDGNCHRGSRSFPDRISVHTEFPCVRNVKHSFSGVFPNVISILPFSCSSALACQKSGRAAQLCKACCPPASLSSPDAPLRAGQRP